MGMKIGGALGEVLDANFYEFLDKTKFLKVLVEMDVIKPLMKGIIAGSLKDGGFWVEFHYKRLP